MMMSGCLTCPTHCRKAPEGSTSRTDTTGGDHAHHLEVHRVHESLNHKESVRPYLPPHHFSVKPPAERHWPQKIPSCGWPCSFSSHASASCAAFLFHTGPTSSAAEPCVSELPAASPVWAPYPAAAVLSGGPRGCPLPLPGEGEHKLRTSLLEQCPTATIFVSDACHYNSILWQGCKQCILVSEKHILETLEQEGKITEDRFLQSPLDNLPFPTHWKAFPKQLSSQRRFYLAASTHGFSLQIPVMRITQLSNPSWKGPNETCLIKWQLELTWMVYWNTKEFYEAITHLCALLHKGLPPNWTLLRFSASLSLTRHQVRVLQRLL